METMLVLHYIRCPRLYLILNPGRAKTHRACTRRASELHSSFQGQRFRTFDPSLWLSRPPKMFRTLERGTDQAAHG